MSDHTLKDENRRMIKQYQHIRKRDQLNDYQQKRVSELLDDWKLFRSNEDVIVYVAYGIHEFPVVYMYEESIDEYVIEEIDFLDDDFEYCVETITMTGREIGELMADW